LLAAIKQAGLTNSVHPKFRLMLLTSKNNQVDCIKAVPSFTSNECRISLNTDHNSVSHNILRHYTHGYTYKPSNDRRIRRMYFAATYFHATFCSNYLIRNKKLQRESQEVLTQCPCGASDFVFMLFLLENFLDGSNIRIEEINIVFRKTLEMTYGETDNESFLICMRNVFGSGESKMWPKKVPEKAAGNRVAALEYGRGL